MYDVPDNERYVIVGGSLAGLTCALALAARGLNSLVLERTADFGQAGGALGIDRRLLTAVTNVDAATDSAVPALAVIKNSREATSWQLLHGWLRGQAHANPLITLRQGVDVISVQSEPQPTAQLADGTTVKGAAILGADGYRSTVRRFVDPDRPLATYTGYMLWRGLVSERLMPRSTAWPDNGGFGALTDQGYRLIAYPVPGVDGSTKPGERQISFGWYDVDRDELLREQGCLSQEGAVLATMPFSRIPLNVRAFLLEQTAQIWPRPWNLAVEIALRDETLFATPISEYMPRRLTRGRVAILGDAAHVATPMTGQGFAMGAKDAAALADLLSGDKDGVSAALQAYEKQRLRDVHQFVSMSQELSRSFARYTLNARNDKEVR